MGKIDELLGVGCGSFDPVLHPTGLQLGDLAQAPRLDGCADVPAGPAAISRPKPPRVRLSSKTPFT